MIGDRWNVSDAEIARHYPCDDFVVSSRLQAWRGVTVHVPAEDVWPWVAQIRVAPYSYDWIDNFGRSSPRELRGLPPPVVGEPFTTAATRRLGRILSVNAPEHLTGRIAGVVISYVLVPKDEHTRLLMKLVMPGPNCAMPLLSVGVLGDLVMARRQLLNLKRHAEHSVPTPASPSAPPVDPHDARSPRRPRPQKEGKEHESH